MNIEEMSKKVTIFYNEDFIVEMVCGGVADSDLYKKVILDKEMIGISIRELVGNQIILKDGVISLLKKRSENNCIQ